MIDLILIQYSIQLGWIQTLLQDFVKYFIFEKLTL